MRIFITAHNCRIGGGISVARNLIAALTRVAPEHEYFVTIPPDLDYEPCCQAAPKHTLLAYRHRGRLGRWFWETYSLPKVARQFKPDVIFNVANRGFPLAIAPQATLLQDSHLFYPFSHFGRISWKDRLTFAYHRQHLRKSLRYTQLVFCQTEVGVARFRATYGDGCDVAVCPNHFSSFAPPPDTASQPPQKLASVAGRFKLFVLSRHYAHKNLEIIPELFRRHRDELCDVAVILTVEPTESPAARALLNTIDTLGLCNQVITVGSLRQEELAGYYQHTDALFLPTLLESFSGTYLEAMAYGRPILTSDFDFAHTVCGDAAQYFDPRDTASICRAIVAVKNDAAHRASLVARGNTQRNSQSLTWDEIARGLMGHLTRLADTARVARDTQNSPPSLHSVDCSE